MSDSEFWNFKKSTFSHQVALVGKDGFIFKPLVYFAMTVILNIHTTYIVIIPHT